MDERRGTEGLRIEGTCVPGFESMRAAFERNFREDGELGAAVSAYLDGRLVVDLWGGYRDEARSLAWEADTIVCMMSVAKAVSALLVHMLVDAGRIDLDAPIAQYWPAFGQSGKEAIPVRWALSHLASVPVADAAPRGAIYDWDAMTAAIAAQAPLWPPGTRPCYHTATQGFILGQILRAVTGRDLGTLLQERLCRPLGLDYHIGLAERDLARCAQMIPGKGTVFDRPPTDEGAAILARGWAQLAQGEDFNSRGWRTAQIPSANGHGTARSIARLYGALARGGEIDGIRLISADALQRATVEQWRGTSPGTGLNFRVGLGYFLNCPPDRPMGPNPGTFGHSGAGGAQSFADPVLKLGFCYAPNRMHGGVDIGPRATRMIETIFRCVQ